MIDQSLSERGFEECTLSDEHQFYVGTLPEDLQLSASKFEELWSLHPDEYHTIDMMGRTVETPRWQQAYGHDYHYTGQLNRALPIPPIIEPHLKYDIDLAGEPKLAAADSYRGEMEFQELDLEQEGRCIVIAGGSPCPFHDEELQCSIYPTRPNVCVAMEAGSEQCELAREQAGLPPLPRMPSE